MAKSEHTGTILQSWVTPKFAREVRELADRDGRSVSNLIRFALRERLDFADGEGGHVEAGGDHPSSHSPAPPSHHHRTQS